MFRDLNTVSKYLLITDIKYIVIMAKKHASACLLSAEFPNSNCTSNLLQLPRVSESVYSFKTFIIHGKVLLQEVFSWRFKRVVSSYLII